MAITRMFHTGFESGWPDYELRTNRTSNTFGITGTNVHTGNTAGVVTSTATSGFPIHFPVTAQARTGFWFRQNTVDPGDNPDIVSLSHLAVMTMTLRWDGTTFTLLAGATTLGTYVPAGGWPVDTWTHFGVDVYMHASLGWVNVYIDGVARITYSGQTTQATSLISAFTYGSVTSNVGWNNSAAIDDLYIDDTTGEVAPSAPPQKRFYVVRPNGDGTYSQFVGSDGNSVNNYLLVDEASTTTTDYVYSATPNDRDSYAMEACPDLTGQTIIAVIPSAIVRNIAGDNMVTFFTRLGGVNLDGASQRVAPDYLHLNERQTTKPGGGPWTPADVNAVEAGVLNA